MPRIDPIQLLNCLSVLLSPDGGIKSRDEVQRLASLMTKFSKKLVSKCIYIQILKCTETSLLGLFMGSGGWRLIHMWLTESIVAKNWPLVRELLELLLLCPVDIERLKTNNCPKLVKELSKDGNHIAIRALASKLVEQWLKTVKGEHVTPIKNGDIPKIINDAQLELTPELFIKNEALTQLESGNKIKIEVKSELDSCHTVKLDKASEVIDKTDNNLIVVKKDVNDAKPEVNSEVKTEKIAVSPTQEDAENKPSEKSTNKEKTRDKERKSDRDKSDKEKSKDKHKSKHKDRSSSKSYSSSKSSSSKSSSHSSSSEKHKSSHKRNDSLSPRSDKDSKEKSKDKHSSSSKSKHSDSNNRRSSEKTDKSNSSSSNKSKEDRNVKTSEKDKSKDTSLPKPLDKMEQKTEPPSIQKLGKIPKLSDVKKDKPSISIEVRKPDEPKPKTVKTFHSKFRKHGLEEEMKPPPSRATVLNKKASSIVPPPIASIPKRPSPVHNETPPEKKPKTVEIVEKPGSIKLIPPKPKPMMLLESDMFMDALNASATNKKEPKKRKRRTSGSKDGNAPGDNSPPHTPTTVTSPNGENKSVPPKFYQDTLDTEEEKSTENHADNNETVETNCVPDVTEKPKPEIEEPMDTTEPHTLTVNGLKGVLCYHKRKGPKKSIKWKPDSELEEIQYFELDETERVNVTKTFTDMKYLERIHEREAFQKGRNLSNDDVMEEKTTWAHLIPIEAVGQIEVEYGKNSKEKEIQAIRQKGTLQPLYFHKAMIPDSALEPDTETHTYVEPTVIPLEDVTGNQDNISDFRNMPWPEPKGNAPPTATNINVAPMFPPQFPGGFPPAQFPGMPGFQGPNMVPGDWQNGVPPHILANGMPMPLAPNALAPGAMPPVNMPPGMLVPPESMIMGPEMFGGPNPLFPGPPEAFGMPQNMFPPDFNMSGPAGPPEGFPGPDSFPGTDNFSGPGNFRGAARGRGSGGHWRGKNSGNWDGPQRGRGASRGNRKAVCIYFQRKGSCRQGDSCAFLHPGVNCPY